MSQYKKQSKLVAADPQSVPASTRLSRRKFLHVAMRAGAAAALGSVFTDEFQGQSAGGATPFVNPGEIPSRDRELRAIFELNSQVLRDIPNVQQGARVRYFQGWDPRNNIKVPDLTRSRAITPGPTLRARVGENVKLSLYNKIDDSQFSYTFVTDKTQGSYGCDLNASNPATYPGPDQFPNCFHASSTANLHFHGTHTSPDGTGDNVLLQLMPNKDVNEPYWESIFADIFNRATPPPTWNAMPAAYKQQQQHLVEKINPSLWQTNEAQIRAGQWPQYLVGAFPNYFLLPEAGPNYKMGQAPGTHWYHAHKHGSTALDILNGLAGAFIIEGPYDDYIRAFYGLGPKYISAFEKVLVIQNISTQQDLAVGRPGKNNRQPLVNGLLTPTITMRPNEVQLWRFINATTGGAPGRGGGIKPALPAGFTVKQTSMDGVQFSPNNYQSQPFLSNKIPGGLVLAGGNRCDLLVQAPSSPSAPALVNGLFYVEVTPNSPPNPSIGKGFPTNWPQMPSFLNNLGNPEGYPHYVSFGWDAEPGRASNGGGRLTTQAAGLYNVPPRFTIDNKQFEEYGPIIDQCIPLNALQDWIIENHTTIKHPLHIHINPFQVMQYDTPVVTNNTINYSTYTPPAGTDPVWQDVILLPAGAATGDNIAPGRVRIRHRFVDFTGTYVLHCHILAHEDRGMMQLVRVIDANKYPGGCQAAIPAHH
jgi:FtsP/CotA-like multicopper oxidase with cupredoxin domain